MAPCAIVLGSRYILAGSNGNDSLIAVVAVSEAVYKAPSTALPAALVAVPTIEPIAPPKTFSSGSYILFCIM